MSDGEYVECVWREVNCQKSTRGDEFSQGVQDFNFSVGAPSAWIPSRSYFKVDMSLTVASAAPEIADAVAFADNAVACLYDNVYFRAGGQDVSSIVNYVPQIASTRTRLNKTFGWQSSIGKGAYMIDGSFESRVLTIAADAPDADISDGRSEVSGLWQPPLGIFDSSNMMGAGDYRFSLNPNTDYKKAVFESDVDRDVGLNAGQVDVVIRSVKLYICTVKAQIPSGVHTLDLMECQAQTKPIGDTNNATHEYNIPASTNAITVFIQTGAKNSTAPPTKSVGLANSEKTLRSIQVTYANQTKPSTRWDSEFSGAVNQTQQRYLETMMESGLAFSHGGTDTIKTWTERGMMYHYTFDKPSEDKSTHVQIAVNFSANLPANTNLVCVAWYHRKTAITTNNGMVVEVQSLNV
jgi:hypothetical protein